MSPGMHADMHAFPAPPRVHRFVSLALVVLLVAGVSIIVAGCGGGSGGENGARSDTGGRSFVPEHPLVIAEVSLREADLQRSLHTLERVPAWKLAKAQLPGKGSAKDVFSRVAREIRLDDGSRASYARDIKPWLGDRAGAAVFGVTSYARLSKREDGFIAWIDVTDEQQARAFVDSLQHAKQHKIAGSDVAGWRVGGSSSGEAASVAVDDGALLIARTDDDLQRALTAHDDGDTVHGDMLRLLDRSSRSEQISIVGDARAGLELAADALRETARTSDSESQATAERVSTALRSDAVRELVPNAVGLSAGIDGDGLWADVTWAGAGKQSTAFNARELVEQVPARSITSAASVSDGDMARRIPKLWSEVERAGGFRLADLRSECPRDASRGVCEAAISYITPLLTTDMLEKYHDQTGAIATVMAATVATKMTVAGADVTPGASRPPGLPQVTTGVYVKAEHDAAFARMVGDEVRRLIPLARQLGLVLTPEHSTDVATLRAKIVHRSPLGAALSHLSTDELRAFAMFGLHPEQLMSAGQNFRADRIDDGWQVVLGPDLAATEFADAITGDDNLGDNENFRRDMKAAHVPDTTTFVQWQDISDIIEQLLLASPETARVSGIVSNNLDHVGGVVTYTSREGDGDRRIGVMTMAVPMYD